MDFSLEEGVLINLLAEGLGQRPIADLLGIPRTTLQNRIKKLEEKLCFKISEDGGPNPFLQELKQNISLNFVKKPKDESKTVSIFTTPSVALLLTKIVHPHWAKQYPDIEFVITCGSENPPDSDLRILAVDWKSFDYNRECLGEIEYGVFGTEEYWKRYDLNPNSPFFGHQIITIFYEKPSIFFPNIEDLERTFPLSSFGSVIRTNFYPLIVEKVRSGLSLGVLSKGFLKLEESSENFIEVYREFDIPRVSIYTYIKVCRNREKEHFLRKLSKELRIMLVDQL